MKITTNIGSNNTANYQKFAKNNLLGFYNKLDNKISDKIKTSAFRDSNGKIITVEKNKSTFDKIKEFFNL